MTLKVIQHYTIQCDVCTTQINVFDSEEEATRIALKLGWRLGYDADGPKDVCRDCSRSEVGAVKREDGAATDE